MCECLSAASESSLDVGLMMKSHSADNTLLSVGKKSGLMSWYWTILHKTSIV